MGSCSQDFDGIDPMIVLISSSSNGINSLKHALVSPASVAYLGWFSSRSLIFFILAKKKSAKSSAKLPESSGSRLHLVVPQRVFSREKRFLLSHPHSVTFSLIISCLEFFKALW